MLMSGAIVDYQVQIKIRRNGTINLLRKCEKLLVAMSWLAFCYHFTGAMFKAANRVVVP